MRDFTHKTSKQDSLITTLSSGASMREVSGDTALKTVLEKLLCESASQLSWQLFVFESE